MVTPSLATIFLTIFSPIKFLISRVFLSPKTWVLMGKCELAYLILYLNPAVTPLIIFLICETTEVTEHFYFLAPNHTFILISTFNDHRGDPFFTFLFINISTHMLKRSLQCTQGTFYSDFPGFNIHFN